MPVIQGHGIEADLPDGWSGRIYREILALPERLGPVTHVGNFAIPMNAVGVAADMMDQVTPGRVACVCMEYVPDDVVQPGAGLFAPQGFPAPFSVTDFDPSTMRAQRPGQAGVQRFFSIGRRPMMLYAVVAEGDRAAGAVDALNAALGRFSMATSPEDTDLRPVARQGE
jgi:hypothetical protein